MLKLKLQYFGHLMQTADSLEKSLMLGKTEGRRRGHQRMSWLDGITDDLGHDLGQISGDVEGQGGPVCCGPWGCKELDTTGPPNNNYNPKLLLGLVSGAIFTGLQKALLDELSHCLSSVDLQ